MKEIWKDVFGYEGRYQVSNIGRVKSLERIVKNTSKSTRIVKERIIKQITNTHGYYKVELSKNSKVRTKIVHQLVAESFLGHISDGTKKLVVDHINNNEKDNRLENLQIITYRHNASKDKKGYSSKYVGVSWCKNSKKWLASIRIKGKCIKLGRFVNEYDAHLEYQKNIPTI